MSLYTLAAGCLNTSMESWELLQTDLTWTETVFDGTGLDKLFPCILFDDQEQVRAGTQFVEVRLNQSLPIPEPETLHDTEWRLPQWLEQTGIISPESVIISRITVERIDQWRCYWNLSKFRSELISETRRLLSFIERLLLRVIYLILAKLKNHTFFFRLVVMERIWFLLHGAHPPKMDAGYRIAAPAFLGRAFCAAVR